LEYDELVGGLRNKNSPPNLAERRSFRPGGTPAVQKKTKNKRVPRKSGSRVEKRGEDPRPGLSKTPVNVFPAVSH